MNAKYCCPVNERAERLVVVAAVVIHPLLVYAVACAWAANQGDGPLISLSALPMLQLIATIWLVGIASAFLRFKSWMAVSTGGMESSSSRSNNCNNSSKLTCIPILQQQKHHQIKSEPCCTILPPVQQCCCITVTTTAQHEKHQQSQQEQQATQLLHAGNTAAAAAAAAHQTHEASPIDVWILAGQSNCVGWNQADGQRMPDLAAPWPGNILAYEDGTWQDAVPNVHLGVYNYQDADSCGPGMAFARTLISTGVSRKVGLVPTAMGGTNLYEHWSPGGKLWSNMVTNTHAALQQLGQQGRLRGMVWLQGEADGGGTMQQAFNYGANFTAFMAATRSALSVHHPELPVLMTIMATRQREVAFPNIEVVAAQQRALQLRGLLSVDMAGYEFYPTAVGVPGGKEQLVHLAKAGCCALGVVMAYLVVARGTPWLLKSDTTH